MLKHEYCRSILSTSIVAYPPTKCLLRSLLKITKVGTAAGARASTIPMLVVPPTIASIRGRNATMSPPFKMKMTSIVLATTLMTTPAVRT